MHKLPRIVALPVWALCIVALVGLSGCQSPEPVEAPTTQPSAELTGMAAYHQQNGRYLLNQAEIEETAGNVDEAEELYAQAGEAFAQVAAETSEDAAHGYYQLLSAQAYRKAGDVDTALETLTELIEYPGATAGVVAEAMYWKADILLEDGDVEGAHELFARLVRELPDNQWSDFASTRLQGDEFAEFETPEPA